MAVCGFCEVLWRPVNRPEGAGGMCVCVCACVWCWWWGVGAGMLCLAATISSQAGFFFSAFLTFLSPFFLHFLFLHFTHAFKSFPSVSRNDAGK